MDRSLTSLVNLIEERAKENPELRRLWATATITFKFSESIRALRVEKNWNEEELAEKSGLKTEVIHNIENPSPDTHPTLEDMVRVSDCLGYKINLSLSPAFVKVDVVDTVFEDVRVIGEHSLKEPDFYDAIAVVAVDSLGRVRLPQGISIEKDNEAIFHCIPLTENKDEY